MKKHAVQHRPNAGIKPRSIGWKLIVLPTELGSVSGMVFTKKIDWKTFAGIFSHMTDTWMLSFKIQNDNVYPYICFPIQDYGDM
jgi:hypothetical protein